MSEADLIDRFGALASRIAAPRQQMCPSPSAANAFTCRGCRSYGHSIEAQARTKSKPRARTLRQQFVTFAPMACGTSFQIESARFEMLCGRAVEVSPLE